MATTYTVTPSVTTVTEGNQVTYTITRTGDKPAEVVYFSARADGTANWSEGDFSTTSGTIPLNIPVNFAAGATSQTVTLNITNDGQSDSGEQFQTIVQRNSSDPASTFLAQSSAVTINDAAQNTTYTVTPSVTTVTEGNQVTYTITRTGDKPAEVVYFSARADGTANWSEGDFSTTSGTIPLNIPVNFAAGATSQTVTLNITNDGQSDSGEQFQTIVQRNSSDPASTFLAQSSAVTINDAAQNTTYTVTPSVTTVTEGNQVTYTITRTGDKPAEVVYFSARADGTANWSEGDFSTTSGTIPLNIPVNFAAGATSQTVTLNITNDGQSDSGEQFQTIVQRNSSDPASTFLAQSSAVTINDAAQNTTYTVTPSVTTVTEGNQVTYTITRTGDKPAEVVYFSARADGTANWSEGDFSTTSGTIPLNIPVNFAAGATSQTVTLNITNDGQSDSGEQFQTIVQRNSSDPASTFLAQSSAVTINDAAQNTTYTVTPSVTTVTEGNQVTYTITRTGDKPAEVVYFSARADGTANWSEGDFSTTSGTIPLNIPVNFAAGATSQTVTLNITNDGQSDSGEQFQTIVQRNSSDPASTFLAQSSAVTINDAAQNTTYTVTPSVTTVTEGNQVTYTITRTGDKPAEVVYFSARADGTANWSEGDFSTTSGTIPLNIPVNFAAGATSQTVTLNITNDGQSDSGEQFQTIVQRNSSDPASTFLAQSSAVTINDAAQNTTYTVTPSVTTVTEGNQVTYTITRTGDKPAEVVYFSARADGTANWSEGDFSTTSGTIPLNIPVNFAAGATSQTVTLNITNDGQSDSGEQFQTIVQRNSSDPASTFLAQSSAVTINDAAQNTTYTVTPSVTTVTEGNQVTYTITRTGDKPAEVVYFSARADGTANWSEGDFSTTSGTIPLNIPVNFAAGATSQTVTLNITNDGQSDSGEQFQTIVQRNSSDPASTFLAQSSAVTINDAAQNTTYTVTPSVTTVTEGNQVTYTITRTGDKPAEVVYFSARADGTANWSEGDFSTTSGTIPLNIPVNFAAGATSQTVTLNITNDGQSDSGEQFQTIVQRNSSDPASTFLGHSSFVTINDASQADSPNQVSGLTKILALTAQIAHADEITVQGSLHLPFAPEQVGSISQRPDGNTSHNRGTAVTAIDFAIPVETEVRSMASGQVIYVEKGHPNAPTIPNVDANLNPLFPNTDDYIGPGKLGNFVTVKHTILIAGEVREFYATYAHLDPEIADRFPSSAQYPVVAGTTLGIVGRTGANLGHSGHVHVQVGWELKDINGVGALVADGASFSSRGESSFDLMSLLHFTNGSSWADIDSQHLVSDNDPAIPASGTTYHGDNKPNIADMFVAKLDAAAGTAVDITATGINAVLSVGKGIKQYVLDGFEDIRVLGGEAIDALHIGSLFGTTIKQDTIFFDGGANDDLLDAAAADRHIVAEGGTGNDTFKAGSGNDELVGGVGADTLFGGSGSDLLYGYERSPQQSQLINDGPDVLDGEDGNDELRGSGGIDKMFGGNGDDLLSGRGGADLLDGGDGIDLVIISHSNFTTPYSFDFGANVGGSVMEPDGSQLISIERIQFTGGSSDDKVIGGPYDDLFQGGAGDDTFVGSGGINVIDGGSGRDSAIYAGSWSNFSIEQELDGTLIVQNLLDQNNADVLNNVEYLRFEDKTVFVLGADAANIARLYSAALGRAPDIGGLSGWEDIFSTLVPSSAKAQGVYVSLSQTPVSGLPSLADGFILSPEFQLKYGALSESQYVSQLYRNVLDREPDAGGLAGWLDIMHSGGTRAFVLVGFAESPENISKTAADWLIQI